VVAGEIGDAAGGRAGAAELSWIQCETIQFVEDLFLQPGFES
jgi:hypothetical protein